MGFTDNEERLRIAKRHEVDRIRQAKEDIRTVMSTPAGRRLMYRIVFERCGLNQLSWAGEAARTTDYNEGRRSVGFEMTLELEKFAPDAWADVQGDALQERKRRSRELEEAAPDDAQDDSGIA